MAGQLESVLLELRNAIAKGVMPSGTRLVEDEISARLNVSRTPVRLALRILEAEGLLERTGPRSLRVRAVATDTVRMAIRARGALEGLVVRELALRGLSATASTILDDCLEEGDGLFAGSTITEEQALLYNVLNIRFHAALLEDCRSDVLSALLTQAAKLPFAGTSYLAYDRDHPDAELGRFQFAHRQHHLIVEAIRERDTGRAEALAREHANNALHYLDLIDRGALSPSHVTVVNGELSEPVPAGPA